ncbi:NAD(P)/FAD-dependent oxidoreductase [Deinococcus peraridilitoris]|uniref:Glycine/D-amino acid oxidase, deaminating n=1 Tax=Deinococcus peraridilitoris (strain DSM 19664 / LMG 22246 / CIP 109416 / KR-200) TaxID=937777 RepID=K9ZYR9_DEIPD|nr:FAD-binding oxidoreductase [Deinococcus peraridilitoris]AFZ66798.1 glycine/D-amino acid oxidase, deaminating [Deinococcus peraridilitoris DSM 19664]
MTQTSDVLVIGAGIIGASCARSLARLGLRVRVLEAGAAPAAGSTGKSAAGVRVQFSQEVNILLSQRSIQEYRQMPEAQYRPQGYLMLLPERLWPGHARGLARQQALGLNVRELSISEAQQLVPFDPTGVVGTTYGAQDGVVDPHGITLAFLREARSWGATLHTSCPVEVLAHRSGVWSASTPLGTFEAPLLVNAAGAWSGEVAALAGLTVPVQPARRMVFTTGPLPDHHACPMTFDLTSGFWLRSEGERLIMGLSNPHDQGFRDGMDWSWLEPTLEAGLARFPWLEQAGLDRRASWWGYYEVTPDHAPILGLMPGVPGWINACGFSGHGVMQAAAVGEVMAQEATGGNLSINIDALRFERFGRQVTQDEHLIV